MVTAAQKAAANKSTTVITENGAKVNLKLVATNAAVARLKAKHHEEFEAILVEECAARGIVYTPPMTEEQKAHKQILDLIAKHGEAILPDEAEIDAVLPKEPEPEMVEVVEDDPITDPVPDPTPDVD